MTQPLPRRARRRADRARRPPDASTTAHYDASNIQVLEGLEAVRKRPGMYIGSTGERGLHHLVTESSTTPSTRRSPATATGSWSRCCADGGVRSTDNGRGIPVDNAPGQELPAVRWR